MAVFSTNQNRQLYVVNSVATDTPEEVGAIQANSITEGDNTQVYFSYYGNGGLIRSDLIDVNKVTHVHATAPEDMQYYLRTATITLDSDVNGGAPISGQDYIVRIIIRNYVAIGDDSTALKYGAVHATSSMDAATFYEKLADSLTANFSREVTPLLTFEATDTGVVVTEVEQPWYLGTYEQRPVNFEIYTNTVTYDGDEVLWAERDDDTDLIEITKSDTAIGNGKKIADLEYFCMGERADQYRNIGWPNVIPTKYLVDPDSTYYTLDVHYSFTDSGVNVQKSEKDITFVSTEQSYIDSLISAFTDQGLTAVYSPNYSTTTTA